MQPERHRPGGHLRLLAAAVMALSAAAAAAQQVRIDPHVQTRLTWTDNAAATARDIGSGWIAEVSPGVSIARDGGRVSGRMDLSLRNLVDSADSDRNASYLAVRGRGQIEAVEDLLFVDVDASISRDNPSLFGGRSRDDYLSASRSNQVRSLGIAPRLQLRFGDTAGVLSYQARWLDSERATNDQRLGQWSASLGNATAFGVFGWGVNYQRSDTAYGGSGSPDVTQEVARATLFINVTPQFRLRAIGGREENDYAVRRGERGTIVGGGFDWNPSPRTQVAGTTEKRIFGRGHDLRINHRRARSAWELGWSRDISSSLQNLASIYDDPVFRLFYEALAASEPDPVERERLTRELLQTLGYGSGGLRDSVVSTNYFVDRRLRAGFSLIGARNVLSFSFTRSDRERLGAVSFINALDDFSQYERVRERSAAVTFNHRLSPSSSLNASASRSHATGRGGGDAETRRTLYSLGLSTSLGPQTSAGLSYRRQISRGSSEFTENALSATFGMRF